MTGTSDLSFETGGVNVVLDLVYTFRISGNASVLTMCIVENLYIHVNTVPFESTVVSYQVTSWQCDFWISARPACGKTLQTEHENSFIKNGEYVILVWTEEVRLLQHVKFRVISTNGSLFAILLTVVHLLRNSADCSHTECACSFTRMPGVSRNLHSET